MGGESLGDGPYGIGPVYCAYCNQVRPRGSGTNGRYAGHRDTSPNKSSCVLDGEGGGNAVQLAEWLAGTDRVGLKRVLCLRDRRELSARALDRLDKSPTVYLLARRASAVDFPFLPGVPCGQDALNTSSRCHSRSSRCGRSIRCAGSAMSCPAWA